MASYGQTKAERDRLVNDDEAIARVTFPLPAAAVPASSALPLPKDWRCYSFGFGNGGLGAIAPVPKKRGVEPQRISTFCQGLV
ncbi:MAG: hypothetical protein AAGA67_04495 [Cyanobacteria bacterium P01_F01_bin.153]